MSFQAFVYGYVNINNGKRYIGYRGSSEIHDGYVFSSEDPELREAWSLGLLRRSILARGTKSHMITMERKLLKYIDARRNDNWYNKSNGGGKDIKTYTTISDEEAKVGIDWINGIDPVEERNIFDLVDIELVDSIWKDVQEGKYEVIEVPTDVIKTFKHNQVRLVLLDHAHAEVIADHMMHDPAEARKNISPIIVCVDENGLMWIIDGNHTSKAIVKAGWTSAPVIYINKSVFLNNQSNVDRFGYIANHNPKIKKPNSKSDCQRAIINLYMNGLAEHDDKEYNLLMGDRFKETCLDAFYPMWTNPQITANLGQARKRIKTDAAEAKLNFIRYSRPELETICKKYDDSGVAAVTVTSGTIYNSGIGAIMNKMGGMGVQRGVIVTHHNNIDDYDSWSSSELKLKKAMELLHPNVKVEYVVLPCFPN
jgi:hypothetical protein